VIEISCSALLFDLDGVLIDSTPAVSRVWHQWAVERGFNPEQVVQMAHGRPSRSTIRELLPNADIDAEDKEVEQRELHDLEGVVPLPGSRELLNSLPSQRWTIVTSCTRALAKKRLQTAGLPIPSTMVTATDVQNGKPHPEPYRKAAATLSYPISECVVVEDAPSGIRAGKDAGAHVIAFPTTMSVPEVELARPNWILRNCADIRLLTHPDGLILELIT